MEDPDLGAAIQNIAEARQAKAADHAAKELHELTQAMRALVSRVVMLERVCEGLIGDLNALKATSIRRAIPRPPGSPFNG